MNNTRMLPLGAMASELGISPRNLRSEALAGRIPCVIVGKNALLFDPSAVDRALRGRATEPAREQIRLTAEEDRDATH